MYVVSLEGVFKVRIIIHEELKVIIVVVLFVLLSLKKTSVKSMSLYASYLTNTF